MNRKHIWSVSIFAFLITVTLAYQNCNNKKFATTAQSMIAGSVTNFDGNGNIEGEVVVKTCDDPDVNCPDVVLVRIYAYDNMGNRKLLGEVEAEKELKGDEVIFKFSFVVPKEYACYKIRAFAYDPVLKVEVEIPYNSGLMVSAFLANCDDDKPKPPEPGGPSVKINSVNKDGRLVQVNGSCSIGANVNFSGDINALIEKKEACTTGSFKHCNLINKYQQDNKIEAEQTISGKQSKDNALVKWSDQPIKVITYETFSVNANEKDITITGYCNPTDIVKVSAYGGATKGETTCAANGTYSITAPILIPSLKDKGRDVAGQGVNSVAMGGSTPIISYDPDKKTITPSCSITQTVANSSVCTQQAGTVKGTCHNGLPVIVLVNGSMQNIGYCEGGKFEVKNVLLKSTGISNQITIEQKTPYGKKCSASKTMTQF